MKTTLWKHLAFAPIALLLLAPQFSQAQLRSWASIDSQLTAASQRADSIWYYGVDHEPIVREMEAVQEAACEAGFDDLYVLSFVELSYVYEVLYMDERYASAVMQAIAEARARLAADDVVRAVALGRYSHYCWNEVPEKEDSAIVWMQKVLPVLEESRFKKPLFWCQLELAGVELYVTFNYRAAGPYMDDASYSVQGLGKFLTETYWERVQRSVYFRYLGDTKNAIKWQKEVLNLISSKRTIYRQDSIEIATHYSNLAVSHERFGNFSQAIRAMQKSIQINLNLSKKNKEDSVYIANDYNNLAAVYRSMGKVKKAIQAEHKAIQVDLKLAHKNKKDSIEIAIHYHNLASYYRALGDFERAIQAQQNAIQIDINLAHKNKKDSANIANKYNNLAGICNSMGKLEKAIRIQQKALQIDLNLAHKNKDDSSNIASDYNNLATYHKNLGDLEKALQAQLKTIQIGLDLMHKNKIDSVQLAVWYNNLGLTYKSMGDFEKAIQIQQKANTIGNKIIEVPTVRLGNHINNLHSLYNVIGSTAQAIQGYKQASQLIPAPRHLEDARTLYYIYLNLGNQDTIHISVSEAESYLKKALVLTREWPISPYLAQSKMGANSLRQRNIKEALRYFTQSLESATKIYTYPNPVLQEIHCGLTHTYLSQGNLHLAKEQAYLAVANLTHSAPQNHSIFLLHQLKLTNQLTSNLALLALTESLSGTNEPTATSLKKAYQTYLLADSAAQRQRKRFAGRLTRLDVSKDALPIYTGTIRTALDLYELEGDSSYLVQAFRAAEKAKGLTMLQSQWEAQAHDQGYLPDTLLQMRSLWLGDLGRLEGRLRGCKPEIGEPFDTVKVSYLETRIFELKEKLALWRTEVAKHYPDYQNRLEKDFEVQLPSVQELVLEEDEVLVEYHIGKAERFGPTQIGEDELYTFVLSKAGLKVYRKPLPKDLDNTVAVLTRTLSDYRYATDSVAACYQSYTQAAHKLYQCLLDTVLRDHPQINQLLVVPHEGVGQIPFEALLTAEATSEKVDYASLPYLLQRCQVRYAYSAAQQIEIAQRPPQSSAKGCLAMAPESPSNELLATRGEMATFRGLEEGQLSGAHREVKRLAEMGLPGKFFFGETATEAAFKEAANDYAVLYLAQHGVTDPEDPTENHLIFSPTPSDSSEDGQLHSYELAGLSLDAQLVVLSACETGVGRYLQGEGVASLGRDFIAAGASSVVMTLWQVEDQASADLMGGFFEQLQGGAPSAEALHQAKKDYLSQADSRTAHPLFWAGYISNGASEVIALKKDAYATPLFAGIGIGLGAVGLLLWLGWRTRRRRNQAVAA